MTLEPLWTPAEVAAHLRKSKSWVYGACERNTIPHLKIGRQLRFDPEAVRAWVKSQAEAAAPRVVAFKGRG